jgi:hypothetical protein
MICFDGEVFTQAAFTLTKVSNLPEIFFGQLNLKLKLESEVLS